MSRTIWSRVFEANLGYLSAGDYEARLLVNGTQEITKILRVSSGDLEIRSSSRYADADDRNHIVGEIRNIGQQPVANVSALISYYDKNGVKIGEESVLPAITHLLPCESSGFNLLIRDNNLKHLAYQVRIGNYEQATSFKSQDLRLIVDASRFLQPYGDALITGEVINDSDSTNSNNTKVVYVIYDYAKTIVIDSIVNSTTPSNIRPGQSAQFVLYSNYHPVDSNFTASCSAESDELGMIVIPEFGSSLGMLVAATSLAGMILILSRHMIYRPS